MFATPAFAQAAGGGAEPPGGLISFVPILLIFAIMYFLMIRPQQKKVKEHKAMVEALRRGDQVVTSGGLIGKVTKVRTTDEVEVEIAPNVKVRVVRSTISPGDEQDRAGRGVTRGVRRRGAGVPRCCISRSGSDCWSSALCLVGILIALPNLFYGRVERRQRRARARRARARR